MFRRKKYVFQKVDDNTGGEVHRISDEAIVKAFEQQLAIETDGQQIVNNAIDPNFAVQQALDAHPSNPIEAEVAYTDQRIASTEAQMAFVSEQIQRFDEAVASARAEWDALGLIKFGLIEHRRIIKGETISGEYKHGAVPKLDRRKKP